MSSALNLTAAELRAATFRTLRPLPDLQAALDGLGFIQADPIRAPARAQDLTLMARIPGYRAGELEACYPSLNAEEDVLPNYGFFPRQVQRWLHPRVVPPTRIEQEHPALLDAMRELLHTHAELHPRDAEAEAGVGRVRNGWGGQSSGTTRALEALHHRGEARVVRRVSGVKVYGPAPHLAVLRATPLSDRERLREAVHLLAALYGPLPEASLGGLVGLSGWSFPHLRPELRAAFRTAVREELNSAAVEGLRYVWPAHWTLDAAEVPAGVRLVGPFDPLVWDRRRFEHLHGWAYRLEAYTPAPKRQFGYYALPMFWAGDSVGWVNLKATGSGLEVDLHLLPGQRQTAAFRRALAEELDRYHRFLGLEG